MTTFTIEELILCARRELGYRKRVYPRLIRDNKMSKEIADSEIALMRAIRENLENQQQLKLL